MKITTIWVSNMFKRTFSKHFKQSQIQVDASQIPIKMALKNW